MRRHCAVWQSPRERNVQRLNQVLPLDDSLDTFTAARIAKVSEPTMRRWCEEGRVDACKPVGRWRIDKASLYALIAAGQNRLRKHTNEDLDAAYDALQLSTERLKAVILDGSDKAIETACAALLRAKVRFIEARSFIAPRG